MYGALEDGRNCSATECLKNLLNLKVFLRFLAECDSVPRRGPQKTSQVHGEEKPACLKLPCPGFMISCLVSKLRAEGMLSA